MQIHSIFSEAKFKMISNNSCSELKLAHQAGLDLDEYQKNFQLNSSTLRNVNNNNIKISKNKYTTLTQISTDQRHSKNPFTFYSKSGSGNKKPTYDDSVKNSNSKHSNKCFDFNPCTFFKSTEENELKKNCLQKTRNDSALNDFSRINSCGIINFLHGIEKSTSCMRTNLFKSKNSNITKNSKSARQQTPISRTEDQEHAFRQIEDVHNYSKLNRYGYCDNENTRGIIIPSYSSSSSNQDEEEHDNDREEDEEKEDKEFDIVDYEQLSANKKLDATAKHSKNNIKSFIPVIKTQQQNEKQDLVSPDVLGTENEGNITLPDHHARRPMNAFLIFCKRHRGIVKDKYKNYENRSITKILGEWWASLDANDKKCYVNLAKKNKDEFFSANPNFKWYKLPAPSLRTLNTRPGNIEREENQCELSDSSAQKIVSPCDMFSCSETKNASYFKLADEKQMGGLNNLMSPKITSPSKNKALQTALSETSTFFGCNRKPKIAEYDSFNLKKQCSNNGSSSEDEIKKKSTRSCKGKKYQELINSGQISSATSKKLMSLKPSTTIDRSEKSQYLFMHIDNFSKVKTSTKNEMLSSEKEAQSKTDKGQWVMTQYKESYDYNKQQFGFVSFDLEDKIKRLPAQCLESYLQRKKNTKRKKKINPKKLSSSQQLKLEEGFLKQTTKTSLYQPKTALEVKEQIIGSQKRKARKESITRRAINSRQNDVQVLLGSSHVTSAVVVAKESPTDQLLSAINQNASSDLLILAEVAANRTETAQ